MGTKNVQGTVSIESISKRIRLRWRFQKNRYSLNLFHFNKANLLRSKKTALQIENDLATDNFDVSLNRYKPAAMQEKSPTDKTLVDHFQDWVKNYRNMDCDRDIDYYSTRSMMLRWGSFDSLTLLHHFNNEKFAATTYNRRLTLLKNFFAWSYPLTAYVKKDRWYYMSRNKSDKLNINAVRLNRLFKEQLAGLNTKRMQTSLKKSCLKI